MDDFWRKAYRSVVASPSTALLAACGIDGQLQLFLGPGITGSIRKRLPWETSWYFRMRTQCWCAQGLPWQSLKAKKAKQTIEDRKSDVQQWIILIDHSYFNTADAVNHPNLCIMCVLSSHTALGFCFRCRGISGPPSGTMMRLVVWVLHIWGLVLSARRLWPTFAM